MTLVSSLLRLTISSHIWDLDIIFTNKEISTQRKSSSPGLQQDCDLVYPVMQYRTSKTAMKYNIKKY